MTAKKEVLVHFMANQPGDSAFKDDRSMGYRYTDWGNMILCSELQKD